MTNRILQAVRETLNRHHSPDMTTGDMKVALLEAMLEAFKDSAQTPFLYDSGMEAADGREWLYDVTCLLYNEEDCITQVPMVAESEWAGRPM